MRLTKSMNLAILLAESGFARNMTAVAPSDITGAMKGSEMSYTLLNINLSDLTAVKITCPQCLASAEFPVARLRGDPPERCFHCRSEWFVAKSPQATALEHLFRALGELRGNGVSGCRVQLVMTQDPGFPPTRVPM
jgi:hypothetical protein